MAQLLTAREASNRMGVKVETIYAYVSRGVLESHPGPGRVRLFDPRAIETLALRGRPRQSSRSTSLNMLIETGVTSLAADGVRYRGLLNAELARTQSFEQVAHLLWLGALIRRTPPGAAGTTQPHPVSTSRTRFGSLPPTPCRTPRPRSAGTLTTSLLSAAISSPP